MLIRIINNMEYAQERISITHLLPFLDNTPNKTMGGTATTCIFRGRYHTLSYCAISCVTLFSIQTILVPIFDN